eukprot:6201478-Pleurochrysis_carterae.AAC.2
MYPSICNVGRFWLRLTERSLCWPLHPSALRVVGNTASGRLGRENAPNDPPWRAHSRRGFGRCCPLQHRPLCNHVKQHGVRAPTQISVGVPNTYVNREFNTSRDRAGCRSCFKQVAGSSWRSDVVGWRQLLTTPCGRPTPC